MARRSADPGPSTCSWPAKSSRRRGRIRSASGLPDASCSAARSKRSMSMAYIMSGMDGQPCPVPKRVGVVHKVTSVEATETALFVKRFLETRGIEVLTEEAEVGRAADLVVVLGGDGTLIHAQSLLEGRPAPILGVNMGSLGFMTEVPQSGLYGALDQVLAGDAKLSERMKLRVHLHRGGRPER